MFVCPVDGWSWLTKYSKNQKCVVQTCSFSLEILVCTPQPCCQCLLLLFVKATQFPCTGQPPALWVCELTELIRYEHMSLWVWVWVWSYEFLCLQGVENLTIVTENVPPLVITNDKSLSKHIWYFSQTECLLVTSLSASLLFWCHAGMIPWIKNMFNGTYQTYEAAVEHMISISWSTIIMWSHSTTFQPATYYPHIHIILAKQLIYNPHVTPAPPCVITQLLCISAADPRPRVARSPLWSGAII